MDASRRGHSTLSIQSSCTFRWTKGGWRHGGTKGGSSDDVNNRCPTNHQCTKSHCPETIKEDSENTLTYYTNNIPGSTPHIINIAKRRRIEASTTPAPPTISPRSSKRNVSKPGTTTPPKVRFIPIEGGVRSRNMISQEAVNFLWVCMGEVPRSVHANKTLAD